jgi:hypothetical protein
MYFCDSVWAVQWMRFAGVGFPYRLFIYVLPLKIVTLLVVLHQVTCLLDLLHC